MRVKTGLFSWFIQNCFFEDHSFFYKTAPRIGVGISGHLRFRIRFKDSLEYKYDAGLCPLCRTIQLALITKDHNGETWVLDVPMIDFSALRHSKETV